MLINYNLINKYYVCTTNKQNAKHSTKSGLTWILMGNQGGVPNLFSTYCI